jgi:hypothetical protein
MSRLKSRFATRDLEGLAEQHRVRRTQAAIGEQAVKKSEALLMTLAIKALDGQLVFTGLSERNRDRP